MTLNLPQRLPLLTLARLAHSAELASLPNLRCKHSPNEGAQFRFQRCYEFEILGDNRPAWFRGGRSILLSRKYLQGFGADLGIAVAIDFELRKCKARRSLYHASEQLTRSMAFRSVRRAHLHRNHILISPSSLPRHIADRYGSSVTCIAVR